MASLMEILKRDQLQARKDRDTVMSGLLTTLISDAAMIGKNDGNRETTDLEVIRIIKKFMANIDDTLKIREDEKLVHEKAILEAYLPQQLSEDDMRAAISIAYIELMKPRMGEPLTMKDMGRIMKLLQEKYAGRLDGKVASQLVRERLSS